MSKEKERPTIGSDGRPLPVLPPERDPRVWARMARVMVYTPGFLAILLLKAGEPTAFGISIELLMLASASAVVGGLFIGSQSEGKGADTASHTGVWSGSLVMELLCAVPILCAVPALFREIATSTVLHARGPMPTEVPLGASEILPALAVVPFLLYQLGGFGTLNYVVTRQANWIINLAIAALILAAYAANWTGAYVVERVLGALLMLGMVFLVWYGVVKLRAMQADYEARRPHKDDTETGKA
ncbi:MAG TPA: hypothetical protein VMK32_13885 [Burkholderiaceae bacterium]|nr:hypothetical protein [Burkholderiaceae bacterium]